MKKRLIAIASLMFCLAVGTVVSYADAPDDEKGQVVVGESVTDEDIGYVQKQEQITANDGLQEQETVQVDKAAITGKVTIEDIDETDGTFSIILSDLQNKEKISQVLMAVWCDTNGQDDLQWFIATKNDKNQYVVRDSVANHKYQLEKYNVGVYAINTDGMQIGIAGTSFEFEKKDVETEIKQNAKDRLQIDINVDNVRIPGGIKNVLIPVWSDINGQDDLIWYTSKKLDEAYEAVRDCAAKGKNVVFVGTKKQAVDVVAEEAQRAGAYYVNRRWLGGMLTNFETIRGRVNKLREIEEFSNSGQMEKLPKKEIAQMMRKLSKLTKTLGGIKEMRGMPDLLVVVDQKKEAIAITEANKLNIPVICLADTNADPDGIDYIIPGNDDAIRSIKLVCSKLADAVLEGKQLRENKANQMAKVQSVKAEDAGVAEEVKAEEAAAAQE